MGYVLKAVLSSAQHPEYGQIMQERLAFHSLQCINGKSVFSSL